VLSIAVAAGAASAVSRRLYQIQIISPLLLKVLILFSAVGA
jgi:hypothetical protein